MLRAMLEIRGSTHQLVADPWVPSDGLLALRAEPGLGVQVDEAAVRRIDGAGGLW
jgi:L-alanine-DL-glutamate epimerase-like enolase superfamily enzyme